MMLVVSVAMKMVYMVVSHLIASLLWTSWMLNTLLGQSANNSHASLLLLILLVHHVLHLLLLHHEVRWRMLSHLTLLGRDVKRSSV